jgi:AI-2 transport protein TqsA
MTEFDPATRRLLAVLVTVVVVAMLRSAQAVFLPLVLALFATTAAWPVVRAVERRAPRAIALVCAVVTVLVVSAMIAGAFVWSATALLEAAPRLDKRAEELCRAVSTWAARRGVAAGDAVCGRGIQEWLAGPMRTVIASAYSTFVLLLLALGYLMLGLIEVRDFETKIVLRLGSRQGTSIVTTIRTIATKVRVHLVALTVSSAVSGVVTGLFALAVGLELAVTWGIVTFLLNYIPTVGPTVAVVPPTIYALLQFDNVGRAIAVLGGIGAIQFFMGNLVDPKIEGRALSLSPLVVLFSVVLWGWIWGALGAVLAVPITLAVVVTCEQFASTRWIAALAVGVRRSTRLGAGRGRAGNGRPAVD